MNLRHNLRATLAVAALALSPVATFAESSTDAGAKSPEPAIPFANRGGIKDWQADGDRGLWIQDIHDKWYYASLMGPCTGLNFANSIGFDTRPMGSFDRFSAIVVPRQGRCTVQTFRLSGPPPSKHQKPNAVEPPPKS